MEYKIYCKDAAKVISTIYDCFKKKDQKGNRVKVDPQGKTIDTWDYTTTDAEKEVLIHTTQQWDKKGCLIMSPSKENDFIKAEFYYWSRFKEEERNGDEDKYYLGRFTEFVLVHFYSHIESIEVSKY